MGNQTWNNLLDPGAVARGSSLSVTTTATAVTPGAAPVTYANELKLGSKVVVEAWGEATSSASAPTLTFGVWYGASSTKSWVSAALTQTSSLTSYPWHLRMGGVVTAVGSSGVLYLHGIVDLGNAVATFGTPQAIPNTAAARQVTIDTTAMTAWNIAANWGAATAGNSLICDIFNVQVLNQGAV